MSTDEQQNRGGFVPIGELADTLPGVIPRGRAMSAQARHHFTTLRQVNQLIEASEAEPDLGFMARLLALCSLPRTDPAKANETNAVNAFRTDCLRELKKIKRAWPDLNYSTVTGGLVLSPSPPRIPPAQLHLISE